MLSYLFFSAEKSAVPFHFEIIRLTLKAEQYLKTMLGPEANIYDAQGKKGGPTEKTT